MFLYFIVNVLWIVATFFLQAIGNDVISIKIEKVWPNGTSSGEYLKVEPLSLMFLLSFAVLLVVQFLAMLYHRWANISQTQYDTWYIIIWYMIYQHNTTFQTCIRQTFTNKRQRLIEYNYNLKLKVYCVVSLFRVYTLIHVVSYRSTEKDYIPRDEVSDLLIQTIGRIKCTWSLCTLVDNEYFV